MPSRYRFLLSTMLTGLLLAGCDALAPRSTPAPVENALTTLTVEAEMALARAEMDVQAARAAFTLWVPAEEALRRAREAAGRRESPTVIREATLASELCVLSARQTGYPSTEQR